MMALDNTEYEIALDIVYCKQAIQSTDLLGVDKNIL